MLGLNLGFVTGLLGIIQQPKLLWYVPPTPLC